ncbi:C40 family peptidase [Robbsia andropogonis]|uniref:C40 family peptidase n=1 Tax=Robbsia andropogonis TaxID=28092 RepID=UPI0039B7254E
MTVGLAAGVSVAASHVALADDATTFPNLTQSTLTQSNVSVPATTGYTSVDRSGVRMTVQSPVTQNTVAAPALQQASLPPSDLSTVAPKAAAGVTQGAIRGPSSADLASAAKDAPKTSFLAGVASKAGDVVDGALNLIGVHYRWGGDSPDSGLDCSGFVRYVFQDAMGFTLPRRAEEMSRVGEKVAVSDLKPGDLVFFNTMRRTISHVGIYIGNNQFVHSPSTGSSIRVDNMEDKYWFTRYRGARRVDLPGDGEGNTDIATRLQQASRVAY